MTIDDFQQLMTPVTDFISNRALDGALADALNQQFPARGEWFNRVESACQSAIDAGWMCSQGTQGRRFGRIIEPCPATSGFSIDVVDLIDIAGPHHRHPLGEICLLLPISSGARFDGIDQGWCVYRPGSAHRPTVSNGRARVLYLLPDGQIEFSP